jgi:hypothetical protein
MEIGNWFKGFEKGLERLSPEQRSAFLSECGRNCVNGGTLSVYQQLPVSPHSISNWVIEMWISRTY